MEIVATNVVASQPPNGDRLQRQPLVPKFLKNFWKYIDAHLQQLSDTLYNPLKPPLNTPELLPLTQYTSYNISLTFLKLFGGLTRNLADRQTCASPKGAFA